MNILSEYEFRTDKSINNDDVFNFNIMKNYTQYLLKVYKT
jgi:hypothetical protein